MVEQRGGMVGPARMQRAHPSLPRLPALALQILNLTSSAGTIELGMTKRYEGRGPLVRVWRTYLRWIRLEMLEGFVSAIFKIYPFVNHVRVLEPSISSSLARVASFSDFSIPHASLCSQSWIHLCASIPVHVTNSKFVCSPRPRVLA